MYLWIFLDDNENDRALIHYMLEFVFRTLLSNIWLTPRNKQDYIKFSETINNKPMIYLIHNYSKGELEAQLSTGGSNLLEQWL